ncbi:MAG: redoxin domain-containing protein, partial [Acetatifactor sp.]|nr:redoxin domain-containing protein [Acetatifactor sp.]
MSLIGKEVSDFEVQAFHKDNFITVKKSDIIGKWSVFFFYPADFTFVCPTELEDLQDKYGEFRKMNCEIYSVSTDSHFVHKAWKDASERIKKLEYPMLADSTHQLSKDFEVLI